MRVASAVIALITSAAAAGAQASTQSSTNRGFVRVTAHDSSGAPIAADLSAICPQMPSRIAAARPR